LGESFFVDTRALEFPIVQSPFYHLTLSTYFSIAVLCVGFLSSPKEHQQSAAALVVLLFSLGCGVYTGGLYSK
jgi:hypothetical protein